MKNLEEKELREIEGGAIGFWVVAGLIAFGTFIFGAIDGFTRPIKCN